MKLILSRKGFDSSAQAHLANHEVGEGDLFVFFALFRPAEKLRGRWRFVPGTKAFHGIWGWLQVAEVWPLDGSVQMPEWASYHPHLFGERSGHNSLYVSREVLALPGMGSNLPGAGLVPAMTEKHRLTTPNGVGVTDWRLPAAFMPGAGKPPLSYHHKADRWRTEKPGWCRLKSAARGQEFVLDLEHYPGVLAWLQSPGLLA